MMPLTAQDLLDIRRVVQDHFSALVIRVYGPAITGADAAEIQRLVEAGILDPGAAGMLDPIKDAYTLGLLRQRLEQAGIDLATISRPALLHLLATDPVPLTLVEQVAVDTAKTWAGQYAKGLGNRVENAVISAINPEDAGLRARLQTLIADETSLAIARRETAQRLASTLGNATQDWSRDWLRIASTEMQRAQEHGRAADAKAQAKGRDPLVAKVPTPDACPQCKRLYLDDNPEPDKRRPRLFRLSELEANGTNVGRKQREWLATVDPIHPHCRCVLTPIPEGWAFNAEWEIVPQEDVDA